VAVSAPFQTIGKPIPRVEGVEKVTGQAIYGADVTPPGTLWATSVRSPYAHARIVSIDTTRARRLPGVRAILTAADLPHKLIGRSLRDMPVVAVDRVRFAGEPVAVIAADDLEIADEAALLVDVEYEELTPNFDPVAAIEPGAPPLHPDAHSYKGLHSGIPKDIPNVCGYRLRQQGDVEAGFAESDLVLEHNFRTQLSHQGYIEPHACTVAIDQDGRVHVWATHKLPYTLREQLAEATDRPESDFLIHRTSVGGDFGSKGAPFDVPAAYHLALTTGRPIKFVAPSHVDLTAMSHRHPSVITIRSGVKRDGRILARWARIIFNTGAYGTLKPVADGMLNGVDHGGGPYEIPNVFIEGFCVYTNLPPSGFMRAPGHPQVLFAVESHMDMIAGELGIERLDFRLRNVVRSNPDGSKSRAADALRMAAQAIDWGSGVRGQGTVRDDALPRTDAGPPSPVPASEASLPPTPDPRPPTLLVGRGVVLAARGTGAGEGTGDVTLSPDGTVTVVTGVTDNGTGAPTVVAQIVAEVLGIPFERIRLLRGDTDALPTDIGSASDRMTNVAGHAVMAAAEQLIQQLTPLAAKYLSAEAARWGSGSWTADDGRWVSLEELAVEGVTAGDPMAHARVTLAQPVNRDRAAVAQAAEVEVDRETGQVRVRKFATVHEVGTIINELGFQGQIDGGFVQGLGYGLSEELLVDEHGRLANANLGAYKMPTVSDVPPLTTTNIPVGAGPGPFNAKGIGELPLIPVAGAIANAVADAIGAHTFQLPISPERVLAAIDRKREAEP